MLFIDGFIDGCKGAWRLEKSLIAFSDFALEAVALAETGVVCVKVSDLFLDILVLVLAGRGVCQYFCLSHHDWNAGII
jgi:hypothetical protein